MKDSIKNEILGKAHELKGEATEKIPKITNDPDLKAQGKNEKAMGRSQHKEGKVQKAKGR